MEQQRKDRLVDASLCAAIALYALPPMLDRAVNDPAATVAGPLWLPLLLVPVRLRRHRPLAACWVFAAACVLSGIPTFSQFRLVVAVPVAVLVALSLGRATARVPAVAGLAAVTAGLAFVGATDAVLGGMSGALSMLAFSAPLCAAVWGAGRIVRARERLARELAERSEQLRRRRETNAALAVEVDRDRLAPALDLAARSRLREMIRLASAGAGHEEAARERFARIERLGRESLDEMRGLLGRLRSGDAIGPNGSPELAPPPPAVEAAPDGAPAWHRPRRSWLPVAATLATAGVLAVTAGGGAPSLAASVLSVALAGLCGAWAAPRQGLPAVVALAVASQVNIGFADAPNLEILVALLPPWWGGAEVRRRGALVRELARRARELEAEQEAVIRLSVERERTRIARELHDIVSHQLAVMVVQAAAGRLERPWSPDGAAGRFAGIREAGVDALAEAGRLVSMLREEDPGSPRLAPVLARARALGARVRVSGPGRALPPEVEAVACRVVQEALTNTIKHAPGAAVDVSVAFGDGELVFSVHNERGGGGSALAATGSGLGLAGMRERVAERGGRLDAGPDGHDGFRVVGRLPVGAAPSRRARVSLTA